MFQISYVTGSVVTNAAESEAGPAFGISPGTIFMPRLQHLTFYSQIFFKREVLLHIYTNEFNLE